MKYILSIIALIASLSGLCQPLEEWAEPQLRKGHLMEILTKNENEFYTLNTKGGILLGSLSLTHYKSLKPVKSTKLQQVVNGSMADFVDVAVIGNHLVVFLSKKEQGSNYLYAQIYDDDLEVTQEVVELASFSPERGRNKGEFSIIISNDRSHFTVVWNVPSKKNDRDLFGFRIYNSDFTLVNDGEYEIPFSNRLYSFDQHLVTDNGSYFFVIREYQNESAGRTFFNRSSQKAVHIFRPEGTDLNSYQIDIQGLRVETLSLSTDNDQLFTIAGIYGEHEEPGVKGLFFMKLNYQSKEVITESFEEFGKDFITQDWSDKMKTRAEKRIERGKSEPTLFSYRMRTTELLNDGSLVGSLEQYYVREMTSTDPRTGSSRVNYIYYYNDIIVFKIDPTGSFNWLVKIPKEQISTNDGGPYSSYFSYIKDNEMHLTFNDNAENYDQNGIFKEDGRLYSASFSKRRNAVAKVRVDITSGVFERKTSVGDELNTIVMPKLFEYDRKYKIIWLYALVRKKEHFGSIFL